MSRTSQAVTALVFGQQTRFFLWVPVWLACGVAVFFSIRFEPQAPHAAVAGAVALLSALVLWRGGEVARVLAWMPLLVALGFLLAMARAQGVAAPKLGWRYYGPVEGRVIGIDRSASDVLRVTLGEPVLSRVPVDRTPGAVRVALHGAVPGTALTPGARIMVTANLSPPGGPVEPGGFDFQRNAWFDGLGAVGYTRAPPVLAEPARAGDWRGMVFAWRMSVADGLRARMPGQPGAFAAAILTGDRSAIDPAALDDLRRSNLAHLLAISGLHMGLLTGFVFAVIRLALAAVPPLALRWNGKKIAAVAALATGAGYLALSGAGVATQRAFVMVAVMLVAVLFDRAAISLRAVAIAATIILVLRPESLTEPGFQMSFAATIALVACFETLNRTGIWARMQRGRARLVAPPLSLLIASTVAAAATGPISAFHFNTVAQYGLAANLTSVPVMGLVVMPAAVLAAVLSLVGADAPALWVMGQGIGWILAVAHWVAALDGSVIRVPAAPSWVLAVVMAGPLFAVLWRGWARVGGAVPVALGLAFWAGADRPAVLVTDTGALVGIETAGGRALSRARGSGFAADTWLENDGDGGTQEQAATRAALTGKRWQHTVGPVRIAYDTARDIGTADVARLCRDADVVILPETEVSAPACQTLDKVRLGQGGAAAIRVEQSGKARIVQSRDLTGTRLWNRP